jgi:hypothetical protein
MPRKLTAVLLAFFILLSPVLSESREVTTPCNAHLASITDNRPNAYEKHSLGSSAVGGGLKIVSITLLGSDTSLQFEQRSDGLHVHLPAQGPGKYAYAFRILLGGSRSSDGK